MGQAFLKAVYRLHAWLGLGFGLLLYLVCLSGTVALFTAELEPWDRADMTPLPAPAPPGKLAGLDSAVAAALAAAGGTADEIAIDLPGTWRSHAAIHLRPGGDARPRSLTVDPASGGTVAPTANMAAELVTRLHTDLLLPAPFGRYLVGLLGAAMLVSLLSGLLLHRKIIGDLFTLRLGRSLRLAWSDGHRSLGLWGLPFHLMMALTGTVLGFAAPALMAAAFAAFEGDLGAAFAEIGDPPAQATGRPAPPLPVSALLAEAAIALPGLVPERLDIRQAGDAGATATIMGSLPGRLVYYPYVVLEAATGRPLSVADWSRESTGRQVYAAVTPLHYGSYGGPGAGGFALKLLYALLGAGSCVLIASGLNIWNSRHAGAGTGARAGADGGTIGPRLARRLTAGMVRGLPLAIAGLFLAGRLLPVQAASLPETMLAIFLALLAASLAWPWWRGCRRGGTELSRALGLVLLLLPVAGWLGHGRHAAEALSAGALPLAVVDAAALLAGLILIAAARPRGRTAGGRTARPAG